MKTGVFTQSLIKYKQVIKFGMVGLGNTFLTFGLLYVLEKLMGIHYLIANPICYFIGTLSSFYFNKKWTFQSAGKVRKEGALFFAVIAVAYFFQYVFMILLIDQWKLDSFLAQFLGMFVFTAINFSGQKFVTFKK